MSPGLIDTKMNAHLSKEDVDALCEEIPMGRMGINIVQILYGISTVLTAINIVLLARLTNTLLIRRCFVTKKASFMGISRQTSIWQGGRIMNLLTSFARTMRGFAKMSENGTTRFFCREYLFASVKILQSC